MIRSATSPVNRAIGTMTVAAGIVSLMIALTLALL